MVVRERFDLFEILLDEFCEVRIVREEEIANSVVFGNGLTLVLVKFGVLRLIVVLSFLLFAF